MNLNSSIDFDLKHFFLWWGRELSFWVPEKFRQTLSDKTGYVFLSIADENLQFFRIIEGQKSIVAELTLNEKIAEQFQQLIAKDESLNKARFVLRLNTDQAIKKTLYLPVAAKENLQQVIAFEMDKYTPFSADQVYFSVKFQGKETNEQIKILLILSPKEILDELCQSLKSARIYLTTVDFEEAVNNFTEDLDTYNLLPESERPKKNKSTRLIIGIGSFVLLLLMFAVLAFPVWYEGHAIDLLRQQLNQLKKDTQLVQSRQLEVDDIVDETNSLIQIKNNTPSLTRLIDTLSQLIKSDTWLTHFKYNAGHLQIQGQSPVASTLIGVLEESPLFSNARFVSPLTQDKKTGLERFQISVDVNIIEAENG